jgi:hypothetical protein
MAKPQRTGKKPRDVRKLRSVSVSFEDLVHEERKAALRKAMSALMTSPMTDDEWYKMCLQLGLLRSPRPKTDAQDDTSEEQPA